MTRFLKRITAHCYAADLLDRNIELSRAISDALGDVTTQVTRLKKYERRSVDRTVTTERRKRARA